eukprot:scaffold376852_cov59-Attheya_sp.AAC.2
MEGEASEKSAKCHDRKNSVNKPTVACARNSLSTELVSVSPHILSGSWHHGNTKIREGKKPASWANTTVMVP